MALYLTLSEAAGGLALRLRDEDGIETVTPARLALQTAHNAEQADAALRTSLMKLGNTMFEADGIVLASSQPWFVPATAINAVTRGNLHAALRLQAVRDARRRGDEARHPALAAAVRCVLRPADLSCHSGLRVIRQRTTSGE